MVCNISNAKQDYVEDQSQVSVLGRGVESWCSLLNLYYAHFIFKPETYISIIPEVGSIAGQFDIRVWSDRVWK